MAGCHSGVTWVWLKECQQSNLAMLAYSPVCAAHTSFVIDSGRSRRQIDWLARKCQVQEAHRLPKSSFTQKHKFCKFDKHRTLRTIQLCCLTSKKLPGCSLINGIPQYMQVAQSLQNMWIHVQVTIAVSLNVQA